MSLLLLGTVVVALFGLSCLQGHKEERAIDHYCNLECKTIRKAG